MDVKAALNNYRVSPQKARLVADQIRGKGVARYRIAQDTGIDESALAKFYNGHRGLSLDNLDRLCEYLGLRVVMDRKPIRKGK